ncbi:hypothetical protein IU11_18740 [Cellulosimicrobium sp. MM]|nr:hypothetical protein IU11_18740 [Cellulosimicrobium sp. MM]
MRVGDDLVGAPPQRATPRAVAVLSTVHGGSTFTWEEWQLLAHDGSDVWVEYDHDTRDVTLLRPTEPWPPVVDLSGLRTGRTLGLTLEGRQHTLTVREHGTGRVEHVEGQFAEPFAVGQEVEYVDLSAHGTIVSIERTTGPLGPVTSVYHGRRLDSAEQQAPVRPSRRAAHGPRRAVRRLRGRGGRAARPRVVRRPRRLGQRVVHAPVRRHDVAHHRPGRHDRRRHVRAAHRLRRGRRRARQVTRPAPGRPAPEPLHPSARPTTRTRETP